MRQRIYCAGPYSATDGAGLLFNTQTAMSVALRLIQRGHHPYIPHLTHYLDQYAKNVYHLDVPYQWWLKYDADWLRFCDALYYIAPSNGADQEKAMAEAIGLLIYTDMEQVPDVYERTA